MANLGQLRGTPISNTAAGTGSAWAYVSGTTNAIYYITDVNCTSTTAASWFVYASAPGVGTNLLWQGYGNFNGSFSTPITGVKGAAISVNMNGATVSMASFSGYQINAQ